MINSRSGISAYMLLDEYTTVEWQQGINQNEIFHRLIKWGNPKFDQNTKYHGIWMYAVKCRDGDSNMTADGYQIDDQSSQN